MHNNRAAIKIFFFILMPVFVRMFSPYSGWAAYYVLKSGETGVLSVQVIVNKTGEF